MCYVVPCATPGPDAHCFIQAQPIQRQSSLTVEQLSEFERLKKILQRMDMSNYQAECKNAHRLLQAALNKLKLTQGDLWEACTALHPGADAHTPTLATLAFTKRITTRWGWFPILHPSTTTRIFQCRAAEYEGLLCEWALGKTR